MGRIYKVQLNLDTMGSQLLGLDKSQKAEWLDAFQLGSAGKPAKPGYQPHQSDAHDFGSSCYQEALGFHKKQSDKAASRWAKDAGDMPRQCHGNATASIRDMPEPCPSNNQHPSSNNEHPKSNQPSGGIVDVDPDEMDGVCAQATPAVMPTTTKPPMCWLDWIATGKPKIHRQGEDGELWRKIWDSYREADNRVEIFDTMYAELLAKLENPRHKIWFTAGQEWLINNYPLEHEAAK